jgi:hypothetical protein
MYNDYPAWVTGVKDWLDVDEYSDAKIGEFIELAQLRLDRELNSYHMEATELLVSVDGNFTLPADFNRVRLVSLGGTGTYDPVSKSEYVNQVARNESNRIFTIDANNLAIWPLVSDGTEIMFDYYFKTDHIQTGINVNMYTEHHADLLLWASMIEGFLYMTENDRLQIFEAKYQNAIEAFNFNPKRIKMGSTPLKRMVRTA